MINNLSAEGPGRTDQEIGRRQGAVECDNKNAGENQTGSHKNNGAVACYIDVGSIDKAL